MKTLLVASLSLLFPAVSAWIAVSKTYFLDDLPSTSSSWLIRGNDVDKGNWEIAQLDFFKDKACKDKVDLRGSSLTSSMGPVIAANAFDNNSSTAWVHDGEFSFYLGFDDGPNVDVKCIMLEFVSGWDKKDMPPFFVKKHDRENNFAAQFEVKGVSEGKNFIDLTTICVDHTLTFWGDGSCSPELRNDACGWDGGDCGDVERKGKFSTSPNNMGLVVGLIAALCIAIACAALYYFIKKRRREEKLLPSYIAEPVASANRETNMVEMIDEPEFENSPILDGEDEERVHMMSEAAKQRVEDEERVRMASEAASRKAEAEERTHIEAEREAASRKVEAEERTRIEAEREAEERAHIEAEREATSRKAEAEERVRIEVEREAVRVKFVENERGRTEDEEEASLNLLEEERPRIEAEEITLLTAEEEDRLQLEATEPTELNKALNEETLLRVEVAEQKESPSDFSAPEPTEPTVEELLPNIYQQKATNEDIVQNTQKSGMVPGDEADSSMLSSRSLLTGGIILDSNDNDDEFVVNTN